MAISEKVRKGHECCRKWRENNREYDLARKRQFYHDNKEKMQTATRKYNAEHRSEKHVYFQVWSKNPRAMAAHAARQSRRRAQKKGSIIIEDEAIVRKIYERAASLNPVRCYLCGKWIPIGNRAVDHIIPLIHNGEHRSSNLAIACRTCNSSKGAKMPEDVGLLV